MAIKTKKVTDLDTIGDNEELGLSNCLFLGSQNGITGKIPYNALSREIKKIINSELENYNTSVVSDVQPIAAFSNETNEQISELQNKVEILKSENTDLLRRCAELDNLVTAQNRAFSDSILSCQQHIYELSQSNQKLIQFIKDLQTDGQLTLAEIKRAAAKAFPISE